MERVIPDHLSRFTRAMAPPADGVVVAMETYGESHGPTSVGREVGRLFQVLTELTGAEYVFEFGSGYGYSGYWFALGGADVVLTDVDESNLAAAREFFEKSGLEPHAIFEVGDAHEIIERYEGPFDIVLVDHLKESYPDAYRAVREKVAPGGLLIADNAMVSTSISFEHLLASLEGRDHEELNPSTRGLSEYLTSVRDDPVFETVLLPIGEGVAVSRKQD